MNFLRKIKFIFIKIFIKFLERINSENLVLIFSDYKITGRKFLNAFLFYFGISPKNFLSISVRPKYSDFFVDIYDKDEEDFCIILQEPIRKKYNFTYETIKLYNKIFPNCLVILSTWENEDKNYLEQFNNLKCKIIISKYPKSPGWKNIKNR